MVRKVFGAIREIKLPIGSGNSGLISVTIVRPAHGYAGNWTIKDANFRTSARTLKTAITKFKKLYRTA